MCAIVAFIAAVVGAGLLIRGAVIPAAGFFAAAAALAAWRARLTPLRRIEATLAAALTLSVLFHSVDNTLAALVGLLIVAIMKAM